MAFVPTTQLVRFLNLFMFSVVPCQETHFWTCALVATAIPRGQFFALKFSLKSSDDYKKYTFFKEMVPRDFRGLQMILLIEHVVPSTYMFAACFLFHFLRLHIPVLLQFKVFSGLSFYCCTQQTISVMPRIFNTGA